MLQLALTNYMKLSFIQSYINVIPLNIQIKVLLANAGLLNLHGKLYYKYAVSANPRKTDLLIV